MNATLKKNAPALLYIFLMTIAFTTRYGDITVSPNVQYIVSSIIIFIAGFMIIKKRKKDTDMDELKYFLKIFFIPHFLMHLYTLILMFVGVFNIKYISTNISVYIPILLALSSIYLFKDKALKYNCVALVISWFVSIIASTISKGVGIFPYAILQAYFGMSTPIGEVKSSKYLELHDLVLSIGLIIVYYMYSKKKLNKNELIFISIIILIMVLGMKRISILGIILSFLFIKFINYFSDENKLKVCKIVGIVLFIVCYVFIYILFNGEQIYEVFSKFNINLMGRNYYYDVITNYGKFSLNYFGIGRNSVTKILTGQYSYLNVGGVHSDILKIYIENGFILFGLWLWYYLIAITKSFAKKINTSTAVLFFTLTIYTFILYFTDNVENYFIYQIFYICIPISYAVNQKKEMENKVKSEKKEET